MERTSLTILQRSWYSSSIAEFLQATNDAVLAALARNSTFDITTEQRDAWLAQLPCLRNALTGQIGSIHLEFSIPRMGSRADAVALIDGKVIVIEFKVGASQFHRGDIDQVVDYALDLKYFHEGSHNLSVVPILVATEASASRAVLCAHPKLAGLYLPLCTGGKNLAETIRKAVEQVPGSPIDPAVWSSSRYKPTPTIIEAARALYAGHNVADISRSDAGARNLTETTNCLLSIIEDARSTGNKAICFVTGVPGAGKTLVGLNIATKYNDTRSELHSTFLSGNGPLVAILREALTRDMVARERLLKKKITKVDASSRVKPFIQNVHHFRDEYLRDPGPPIDHVALFDEAQRAWDKTQTAAFMRSRKNRPGFEYSEPEFLISCMDRRPDWAVIVCLVGGGQEIHRGEAGIGEWIESVARSFKHWHLYLSPHLVDSEYGAGKYLRAVKDNPNAHFSAELHLGVSVRSFRSENVSAFVKNVLDCEVEPARELLGRFLDQYPIFLTRDLDRARQWLRDQASGSERYGIVVSSQAERLKPLAIDVRTPVDPVKWFLDDRDDIRSSYYLEDVATEFHVQGLELDYTCVSWDGDFRFHNGAWQHFSFKGKRWERIKKDSRQLYQKNAYRVLLTRARQGMVIFVPKGSTADPTRAPEYYDGTYEYLKHVGLPEI